MSRISSRPATSIFGDRGVGIERVGRQNEVGGMVGRLRYCKLGVRWEQRDDIGVQWDQGVSFGLWVGCHREKRLVVLWDKEKS